MITLHWCDRLYHGRLRTDKSLISGDINTKYLYALQGINSLLKYMLFDVIYVNAMALRATQCDMHNDCTVSQNQADSC